MSATAPRPRSGVCRLVDIPIGATARIIDARVDPESRAQLRALGLTDHSLLRVCKQGEPYVVQVRATRIGISRRIAEHVLVVPEEAETMPFPSAS